MCEILLMYFLGKRIAAIAGEKGRGATGYVIMMVLLWVSGEVVGGIFGAILVGGQEDKMVVAYACALFGAVVGAGLSFLIVSNLSPLEDDLPRRRRPRRDRLDEDDYDRPRRRRRDDDEDDDEDRPRRRPDDDGSFKREPDRM